MDFPAMLETVALIARQAGEISRSYHRKPVFQTHFKGEYDIVTNADREAEAFLSNALKSAFPAIGIIGEEGSSYIPQADTPYFWYVDPIDGTNNFAHGLPHFSVSIGLASATFEPILGVIYDPMRDECFTGYQNGGAFLNGRAIKVSEISELRRASLSSGFPYDHDAVFEKSLKMLSVMTLQIQGLRVLGSGALDLAYVASGRLDGYWESKLSPWDCCAGIVIVREAGGKVTDLGSVSPQIRDGKVEVFASNGRIHADVLKVLQAV